MCTKNSILNIVIITIILFAANPASAHFGTIIPSDDIVTQDDSKTLNIEVKFIHPMELHDMEMVKPKQFAVIHNGQKIDLLKSLKNDRKISSDPNKKSSLWTADYKICRPGDYTFFIEPMPYWEPAEDVFIVHYTKVCVNALGLEKGWDQPVGLETEIIPLTRPYGLWTGNLFTGQVLLNGKPVSFAEIEIEYLNNSPEGIKRVIPPADPYITQVVKSDKNGVFSYAMPRSGWWGFSALNEAGWKLENEGQEKGVEIGAVYWVYTRDMK